MPPVTFADDLEHWTDWDVVAHSLGLHLGILTGNYATNDKWLIWIDNAIGDALDDALLALARAGVLERREEPEEQFRWRGARLG